MAAANTPEDDSESLDAARTELQDAVPDAAETIRELLDAEDERVRLRAAEAILDRAGITKAKASSTTVAKRDVGGEDNRPGSNLF
jgi:HEAT repeat protein